MEEYILQPEDRIRILDGRTIELFCDRRTMIFFELAQLEQTAAVLHVPADGDVQPALRVAGPDSLMGARYAMLVPQSHPDYAALRAALPDTAPPEEYHKPSCDHTGPRRRP